MIFQFCLFLILSLFSFGKSYAAPTDPLYQNNNIQGGMTFTGNTSGLDIQFIPFVPSINFPTDYTYGCPGTLGCIGTFITTNNPLPPPVCTYPDYPSGLPNPAGTTILYASNSSSAYLDLPPGSTVVYAELIWGGSYGYAQVQLAQIDAALVTLQYENGTVNSISQNPNTAQSGPIVSVGGLYVRSQTVTSIIQANGAGYYTVGGVPGTVGGSSSIFGGGFADTDAAGWVLAVIYENPSMYTSSISLWVDFALLLSASTPMTPLELTGFITPTSGPVQGFLYAAALEGDVILPGDQMLFGSTNPPTNILSGANNPASNFFTSQINTLYQYSTDVNGKTVMAAPTLDTRGSYGVGFNANAFTGIPVSGQRQSMDITAIDISTLLSNGQTTAYIQGTNIADVYALIAQGLVIRANAPIITFVKTVDGANFTVLPIGGGTPVTFDFTLTNVGTADATTVLFQDDLTVGNFTYISGTFLINGVLQPDPDLSLGVSLPDLTAGGASVTLQFQAFPPSVEGIYPNTGNVSYEYLALSATVPGMAISNQVSVYIGTSPNPPVANDDFGTTPAETVYNSTASVIANDTGSGILASSFDPVGTAGGTITMDTSTDVLTNGFFTYTPPAGFSGNDTFEYTISDIYTDTASATVHMTVLPRAISDNLYSVTANTPLIGATPSVLANDIGSNLSLVSYEATTFHGGIISMVMTGANAGTFDYTPPLNFSGIDTFNYTIQDSPNLNQSSATVTIVVLPVAEDDTGTTPANTPLNGTTTFIGTDDTVTSWQNPSTQGGTVVFTDINTGAYTYTPPTGYSGLDTFTYTITDGGGNTSTGTVTITVVPLANNDTGTTYANTVLVAPISILSNDIGTNLTVNTFVPVSAAGGTVSMPLATGIYTYTPPTNFSGQDRFTYTVIGNDNVTSDLAFPARVNITVLPVANDSSVTTPAETPLNSNVTFVGTGVFVSLPSGTASTTAGGTVNFTAPSTGAYTYVPPAGFSGIDTFTFTVQDSSGGVSSPATVTIFVTPFAADYTYTIPANTPFNGPSVFTDSIATSPTVIAPLSGSTTEGGTFSLDPTTGTFIYTPPMGFLGTDHFSYTIMDSSGQMASGTVTLNVGAIEPPSDFTGCVKKGKFINTTEYVLYAIWNPSPTINVAYYRIYRNGVLVATIPVGAPRVFKTCVKSKRQASEYTITAVDSNGNESTPVTIVIKPKC